MTESNAQTIPTWIGLGEAVDVLGVHETTVRRWADSGAITTIRTPGRQRRFSREDCERIAREGVAADTGSANPAFLLVPPALLLALVLPYSFALNIAVYLLAIPTCVGLGVGMLRGRRDRAAEAVERRESAIAVRRIYGSAR